MRVWGSLYSFQPYTHKHVIVLAVLGGAIVAGCLFAKWLLPVARRRLEIVAAVAFLLTWFAGAAWDIAQPGATVRGVLPLHWCDLTGILAGVVLLRPTRDARAALHLWGLCFTAIAFIAPVEARGPAQGGFWAYFLPHGVILMAVAYDAIVRGYRPTFVDVRRIGIFTAFWVVAVMPFNLLYAGNYAYVGDVAAGQRSLVEAFGPWPLRIAPMYLVSLGVMLLLVLAQRVARRERTTAELVMQIGPRRVQAIRPSRLAA